ncbi:hypothetical protein PO909_029542 [Leuciscus waleckii]
MQDHFCPCRPRFHCRRTSCISPAFHGNITDPPSRSPPCVGRERLGPCLHNGSTQRDGPFPSRHEIRCPGSWKVHVFADRHREAPLVDARRHEGSVFLNAPLSPTGLFGPAVNGIVDRFSEVQKTTQAMNLFLPRRSSSAARRPRDQPAQSSTQRPARPPSSQRRQGGCPGSRSTSRNRPPPSRGPRPKIALKPEPAKSSKQHWGGKDG